MLGLIKNFLGVDEHTSTMQTSGSSPDSSTGTLETRSIQSCISFVTWGTIYAGREDLYVNTRRWLAKGGLVPGRFSQGICLVSTNNNEAV